MALFESFALARKQHEEIDVCGDISAQTFEEVINALQMPHTDDSHGSDLKSISTKDKIRINALGESSVKALQESIVYFSQPQDYIRKRERTEPSFHNDLCAFFRNEYVRLLREGKGGDTIFTALIDSLKSKIPNADYMKKCCVPPIVTYLFVICDLFARTEEELAHVASR